jgi:hypothetical protein
MRAELRRIIAAACAGDIAEKRIAESHGIARLVFIYAVEDGLALRRAVIGNRGFVDYR